MIQFGYYEKKPLLSSHKLVPCLSKQTNKMDI